MNDVSGYLGRYGYWAIFFGVFFENFGVPLPGETLIIAGGILAAGGQLNLVFVIFLAVAAAFTGDNLGYVIGRFGGRRFVLRFGKYVLLNERRLRRLEDFFHRHGGKTVAAARFIEGLRQFNGPIAGVSGMRWSRFWVFNLIGASLWVVWWASAAYILGDRIPGLFEDFVHLEIYGVIGLIPVLIAFVAYRRARSRT